MTYKICDGHYGMMNFSLLCFVHLIVFHSMVYAFRRLYPQKARASVSIASLSYSMRERSEVSIVLALRYEGQPYLRELVNNCIRL